MFINSTVNKHSHLLLNGQVIEHAHPFNSENDAAPFKNHNHTNSELILLSLISNPICLILLLTPFLFFLPKVYKLKKTYYKEVLIQESYTKFPPNKAPPAFLYY